ncbi:hypothetical protein FZEAL_6937 [Fusarium zealandicum]|uniref:Myb/SANT-like domain-containing protein n=1 Tax=Fusarium zealandicum TaxID=1053134 RepID=A0A8H4UHC5_9HYPO|nr:hypothetical protein FZEAL_6937 [Fusarium zealandicum]
MSSQEEAPMAAAAAAAVASPTVIATVETPMPPPPLPRSPGPTPNTSRSLSTPAPAAGSAAAAVKKPARMVWRKEMTVFFLELLRQARAQGKLRDQKASNTLAVMEDLIPEFDLRYPRHDWQASKLVNHYKNLRAKHKIYLWLVNKSGACWDSETGLVEASDENWEAFQLRFGKSGMWLKTAGLPRADLYDVVFDGNEPAGETIAEAGDEAGLAAVDLTRPSLLRVDNEDDPEVDDDFPDGDEDSATDTGRESSQNPLSTPTPSRRRFNARLSSKRDRSGSSSAGRGGAKRIKSSRDSPDGFSELVTTLERHTNVVSREAGVIDIERAIQDGKDRFQLSGLQLAVFLGEITKPLVAVAWNNAGDDDEAKRYLLRGYLRDVGGFE